MSFSDTDYQAAAARLGVPVAAIKAVAEVEAGGAKQIARNATMDDCGALRDCRYLLHDRDAKFTRSFRAILVSGRVKPLALPARSPNLNAYAERWVRSVKDECLSKVILFGERSLRRALRG